MDAATTKQPTDPVFDKLLSIHQHQLHTAQRTSEFAVAQVFGTQQQTLLARLHIFVLTPYCAFSSLEERRYVQDLPKMMLSSSNV